MSRRTVLHEAIKAAADPMTLLDRIVAQAIELVPAADGASLEVRRDVDLLEYVSAAGTLAPFIGLRLPLSQSMSGLAVLTGEVQRCDDGLDDPRVNRAAVERTGLRSMLCVPLSDAPDGVAVLKLSSRQTHAFRDDDIERLRLLARFMDEVISGASRLAQVTADVLTEIDTLSSADGTDDTDDAEDGVEAQVDVAQFVANIMTPGLVDRAEAAAAIREVIAEESLDIVVQPIIELTSGAAVGCEALSRIRGPIDKPTDWWFATAHRLGLGPQLELLAVRHALAALPELPASLRMSINVGVELLLQPGFADVFDGAPAERLTIELTEHERIADYAAATAVIDDLRARGMRLSVDDTGSGYSGLTNILRLRPDVIKLDRELVTGLHDDPAKRALAAGLILFARSIGAQIVAEGLEHKEEAECLTELGADQGQGFLYAHPMPAAALALAV